MKQYNSSRCLKNIFYCSGSLKISNWGIIHTYSQFENVEFAIGTKFTNLVEVHSIKIPVKFGFTLLCGFREKD